MVDPKISINNKLVHVPAGAFNSRFLTVPLAGPGDLTIDTAIRVTIGLKPKNTDSDPAFGFTDGTEVNEIILHDKLNYRNCPPCYLSNGVQQNTLVPANTPPFTEVTLTFQPYRKYGTCHTAQNGGYVNVGTFNAQLDITKGLSLVARRHHATETYDFYYFHVEII